MHKSPTAAIQGENGSNSATAARMLLGDDVQFTYCDSFQGAFDSLDSGESDCALLPIENTTAGLIQPVWDRLLGINPGPALAARQEARVRIGFVAAALPGQRLAVRKILAHSVAAAQCHKFLKASGWNIVPCHDTAGAARLVREANDPSQAALCPLPAARIYDLEVLNDECGDSSRTWTRFLLLEHGNASPRNDDDRAILLFSLRDVPGALVETLACFSRQGLNLGAIHSRAIPGYPGQYRFFIELGVGACDRRFLSALADLEKSASEIRLLGSYPVPAWPETISER
jgi:prephenate dehydratase